VDAVRRWVRWFDGEALAGEVELRGADLPFLQRLVGAPPSDPLYDCWPIHPARLSQLAAFGPVPVASPRFDYFLEADADLPDATEVHTLPVSD
jgi:hypothetical protein